MQVNRVLLVLVALGLAAGIGPAFLSAAPNRLMAGTAIPLIAVARGPHLLALLPALVLLAGPFLPQRRAIHVLIAASGAVFLLTVLWLAGVAAADLAGHAPLRPGIARISLGGGFWLLFLCAVLALLDALQRLRLAPTSRLLVAAALLTVIALLAASGAFDQLALAKEYAARRDAFASALFRHAAIVLAALTPTVVLGTPLGVLAARHARLRAALFPILNIVQTVPSIALFGLLIAPLSALGIGGIGAAPAIIALFLYALLPIVRNTAEGVDGVPSAVIDAARGMGMTRSQILWRVELPLALPVLLSGLRIATVQTVGLAAVAALIGAGGLGAIMFEGLFADALDLVLLGAVPVILLALAAETLFAAASAAARRVPA
ncbi:MAG TPA: ABC transporter permease [Stellaceae bacterium]|nr:ABC transporter permease [Stellaceae bacterium]